MAVDSFMQQFVNHLAMVDAASIYRTNGLQQRANAEFCLVQLDGDAVAQSLNLTDKTHVDIGRHLESTMVLCDATCSRHHCRMTHEDGRWVLEDLLSRNGTYVNGTKIHGDYLLCNGDEIQIGKTRLLFSEVPKTDA